MTVDVYGLGAVLYLMLTGKPPFEAPGAMEVVSAHLRDQAAPPSTKRGSPLPGELDAIVLRCLEKDPGARFPSARPPVTSLMRSNAGSSRCSIVRHVPHPSCGARLAEGTPARGRRPCGIVQSGDS